MKSNYDFYLELSKDFKSVLSEIDFINYCNEWEECNLEIPDTFEYYDTILNCECYQGGFINDYQYKKLHELLKSLYFLNEIEYMLNISKNKETLQKLKEARKKFKRF